LTYQQFLPLLSGPQKAITVFYNASNTPDPCIDAFFAVVALPAVILSASTVLFLHFIDTSASMNSDFIFAQGTYTRYNSDLSVPANGPVSIDLHAYRPSSYLLDGGLEPILLGALLTPMQSVDVLVTDLFRRASNGNLQFSDCIENIVHRLTPLLIRSWSTL
jgi:hypothetical protein